MLRCSLRTRRTSKAHTATTSRIGRDLTYTGWAAEVVLVAEERHSRTGIPFGELHDLSVARADFEALRCEDVYDAERP